MNSGTLEQRADTWRKAIQDAQRPTPTGIKSPPTTSPTMSHQPTATPALSPDRPTRRSLLLYVAGPYRDPKGRVVEQERNIRRAELAAQKLWQAGFSVICPHLNTKHFDGLDGVTTDDFLAGDLTMLSRCDALVMLPGWTVSKGACGEHMHAHGEALPIFYFDPGFDTPAEHAHRIDGLGGPQALGKWADAELADQAEGIEPAYVLADSYPGTLVYSRMADGSPGPLHFVKDRESSAVLEATKLGIEVCGFQAITKPATLHVPGGL